MINFDTYSFAGKRAIVRVDFNVPLDKAFNVTDDNRIRAALPTIKKILSDGGSAILMSHLGRPKDGPEEKFSLKHILPTLSKHLGVEVKFAPDCIGAEAVQLSSALKPGEVLLLENLRFYKEEEKGDEGFAQKLANLADVYVNDAFGTAHRAHASTTIIAKFFPQNKMFGYLIQSELNGLEKVLHKPQKPYTAVLGGAKVSTKITIIENLMDKVDNLIIGGGMMFTFIKAQGGKIGSSMVEDDKLDMALDIMAKAKQKGVNILLPVDTVIADSFSNEANSKVVRVDDIPEGWLGLDIAQDSVEQFSKVIENSKTILWNGPMGVFEMPKFAEGTKQVAKAMARATANGAFSLVGGGDSVAAINSLGLADEVSYVSTGGGALLEYLENGDLPGIKAVRE
ncbi:MAG: phosphoglycerate kinase [Tenuifilaceae bacterium]|jgi:phosphoglycerate kinase|uniref:phosphoglycerate kinase n=1 Tax=Perlabentimonas gracilis TaxID=2715279 RepID=UPI0014081498|nr:phosphoglycerate kinase [Perlabentimonas gracilis]MDX9768903.1 phosphoglycerate kinase [Tenuifilaceae bacterium]NHB69320.1 phosphoglycerate kinase [Perlabentimonas gracilis]